jgi:site-specific recombinase XerD
MANCIKCKAALPDGALFCPMCGKKQVAEKRKALKRANGTGTVYKLSGRRARPWVAAKNRVVIGYYERKTDALDALERLNGKPLTERYNMTFAEVFEAWKAEHYKEIGKQSIRSYDAAFKVFASLHDKKFRDLRTADFQAVLAPHMGKSRSTVSKHKNLITQMSEWAMREEICTTNFAQFIKVPEAMKKEKNIFTEEDIQKLEKDGSDAAKIVLMLLSTGMRIGELFSLPVADYHGAYVVGGEKTDAGRNRIIPIRPEGRQYFEYFVARATGELLISGYSGQKVVENFRKRDFYPLLDRLGISKKTPHATRHTYASRAVKEGLAPEMLQKILGHADYSTTANVYTHIDPETLVSAVTNSLLTIPKKSKKKEPRNH